MLIKDNAVINNYFTNKNNKIIENGLVVECGTAEGFHNPSLTLEKEFNWKFFGFEADPRYYPVLCQNRPNSTNINAALSDKNGKIDFIISAWGGNSSIEHSEIHKKELLNYDAKFDDGSYFKTISVATMNWDYFINFYNIKNVDFLILDVEGQELKILNGMSLNSKLPNIIQIEFGYSDHDNLLLNEEKKENFSGFIKVSKRLFELNYQFDYVSDNNALFSQKSFWNDKNIPTVWMGEDESFFWKDMCYYDKTRCKEILRSL
jgi:FkbM family methyltransferase